MRKNSFAKASHHELELKFDLTTDDMDVKLLRRRFLSTLSKDFTLDKVYTITSPDVYYRQGKNVLRFRADPKKVAGELTVKLRTSKQSIANRVEVDLHLSKKTTDDDVRAFLAATGWGVELAIDKTSTIVHIGSTRLFPGQKRSPPTILAFYVVNLVSEPGVVRAFLEVELDKDHLTDLRGAEKHLRNWHRYFLNAFPNFPREPVGKSLYELYTGKTYQMAREK
jgi:hypothetical protein